MRKPTRFEVARLARRAEAPAVVAPSTSHGFDVSDAVAEEAAAVPELVVEEVRPLDINREGYRDAAKEWHPPPSSVKAYGRHIAKGCATCKAEALALNVELKVEA